jgi:hypothetical protein
MMMSCRWWRERGWDRGVEGALARIIVFRYQMWGCLQERDNIGFAYRQRERTVM